MTKWQQPVLFLEEDFKMTLEADETKTRLGEALSNLICWVVSLPMAKGLKLGGLQGPFQPQPFCNSVSPSFCPHLASEGNNTGTSLSLLLVVILCCFSCFQFYCGLLLHLM